MVRGLLLFISASRKSEIWISARRKHTNRRRLPVDYPDPLNFVRVPAGSRGEDPEDEPPVTKRPGRD